MRFARGLGARSPEKMIKNYVISCVLVNILIRFCLKKIVIFYVNNYNSYKHVMGSGVVVVERLERSLQFLFSRVERRSSSCFTSFLSILFRSCRNWHFNQIITVLLNYLVICSYAFNLVP